MAEALRVLEVELWGINIRGGTVEEKRQRRCHQPWPRDRCTVRRAGKLGRVRGGYLWWRICSMALVCRWRGGGGVYVCGGMVRAPRQ